MRAQIPEARLERLDERNVIRRQDRVVEILQHGSARLLQQVQIAVGTRIRQTSLDAGAGGRSVQQPEPTSGLGAVLVQQL